MLNRNLGRASYLVAFTLIAIPLFDSTMSVMPLRMGDSRWRFGTVGLLSNALMIPMAGLLIAFVTAHALEQRRMLRFLGVISALGCGICAFALAAFTLDSLQSQGQIRANMQLSFRVATATAAVKIVLGGVAFLLFAFGGLKGPKQAVKTPRRSDFLIRDSKSTTPVVNG